MGLPETIRVKISSEAAEWIALTPVVARDIPVRELLDAMLSVIGKDAQRVRELLRRGSFVSGASRFRWQGLEADLAAVEAALEAFPDAEPSREFSAARCFRIVLRGGGSPIELSREIAEQRRAFRRRSFWDLLMDFAGEEPPRYRDYSYREKADVFASGVTPRWAAAFAENAGALRYSSIEASLKRAAAETAEFYVAR